MSPQASPSYKNARNYVAYHQPQSVFDPMNGVHPPLEATKADRLRQSESRFTPAPGALSRVEVLRTR